MNNNLVLYHSNCHDGLAAALLMKLYFDKIQQTSEHVAVNYGEDIPDLTGKNVYIVDFSYPREKLEEASKLCKSITMLDHHLSAAKQWDGYKRLIHQCSGGCWIDIDLQEEKSGALLTLEWIDKQLLFESDKGIFAYPTLRRVIHAVSDRDLWNFKYEGTEVIYEALCMIPRTIESWEEFIVKQHPHEFNKKLEIAQHYLDVKESLAQDYAKKHQLIQFSGYEVPIVNVPSNFTSRVGEILSEKYPFAIMYCLNTTTLFTSLRSNKLTGIDVEAIAKKYGGGGHLNAAACKIPLEQILDLLQGKL